MKKSKKALLWTIVPVLGVSSGVAGAVAGVTNQKTSVDTNNVATSSSATTMATKSSKSTSNLEIVSQTRDLVTYSDHVEHDTLTVVVKGATKLDRLRYQWYVNKGDRWNLQTSITGRQSVFVDVPKGIKTVQTWTYKCVVTDLTSGSSITSENIKFTITPWAGRYVEVTKQPTSSMTVSSGEKFTLETEAKIIGRHITGKTIGYQWFEYDSESDKFTLISGANTKSYTFTTEHSNKQQVKKYVCRYYFTDNTGVYVSESSQSTITINKGEEENITISEVKASPDSINVGQSTTLSVKATSNVTDTKDLTYQWYKLGKDDRTFEVIKDATSSTYTYKASDADDNKELIFCVLVGGSTRDGVKYHKQSDNLMVKVGLSSETTGSIGSETVTSTLKVSSSVTTNQATVRSKTFYLVPGIKTPEYTVNVEGGSELSYKWYYVGRDGKQHLIKNAESNVLTANKSLYEAVYKANDKHRVGIMCEIYQGSELVKVVDEKTDSRFYMTVITRR